MPKKKNNPWEDLSDIKSLSHTNLVAKGRRLVKENKLDDVVSNSDMSAVLIYRSKLRHDRRERTGCCGDECRSEQGYCRIGRCQLVVDALKLIREIEGDSR